MYRIQQFATLAGVTVRTLRHYDRLGLLVPQHRMENGYRLYRTEDLADLERILVLRYLGLSLREIAELLPMLQTREPGLAETLSAQATVLRRRREEITRVLRAIERAQRSLDDGVPDWTLFKSILKEITMQDNTNWTAQYYSPEANKAIEERRASFTPEMQTEVTAKWNTLVAEVEAAIAAELPVDSPEARALAGRWMSLVGAFTGGSPTIAEGLKKLYADRQNWPEEQERQNPVKPELIAWIRRVQVTS